MTGQETGIGAQILQAAARLTDLGLISRTWGNISARVSDSRFLITPSGLAYETLREDQLVPVSMADGSWTGKNRPSSEKGIHAGAYRLRPEVNFIIHTHQYWASVAGVAGRAVTGFSHPLLGKRIPCAAYGLPGTKRLCRAVEAEERAWPDCRAFLLRSHGALCLGQDMEDAFALAQAMEEVCMARVRDLPDETAAAAPPPDLGHSFRQGDAFTLTVHGVQRRYPVTASSLPPAAALHAAVYRGGNFQYIAHEADHAVTAVSGMGAPLRPYLDDLAQIAGADIRCVPPEPQRVERAVRGRNAVLLRSAGALCASALPDDLEAVRELLRKGCAARLYAREVPPAPPLGRTDALLQRTIYLHSYSKKRTAQC